MKTYVLGLLCLTSILFTASTLPFFSDHPVLPATPYDYSSLNLPAHFLTDAPNSPLPTSINGTDNTPTDNAITDPGAGTTFPNNPIFDGRFKTSSLRNVELTAPYMHDYTEQVLKFRKL